MYCCLIAKLAYTQMQRMSIQGCSMCVRYTSEGGRGWEPSVQWDVIPHKHVCVTTVPPLLCSSLRSIIRPGFEVVSHPCSLDSAAFIVMSASHCTGAGAGSLADSKVFSLSSRMATRGCWVVCVECYTWSDSYLLQVVGRLPVVAKLQQTGRIPGGNESISNLAAAHFTSCI